MVCSVCKKDGHNKRNCPTAKATAAAGRDTPVKESAKMANEEPKSVQPSTTEQNLEAKVGETPSVEIPAVGPGEISSELAVVSSDVAEEKNISAAVEQPVAPDSVPSEAKETEDPVLPEPAEIDQMHATDVTGAEFPEQSSAPLMKLTTGDEELTAVDTIAPASSVETDPTVPGSNPEEDVPAKTPMTDAANMADETVAEAAMSLPTVAELAKEASTAEVGEESAAAPVSELPQKADPAIGTTDAGSLTAEPSLEGQEEIPGPDEDAKKPDAAGAEQIQEVKKEELPGVPVADLHAPKELVELENGKDNEKSETAEAASVASKAKDVEAAAGTEVKIESTEDEKAAPAAEVTVQHGDAAVKEEEAIEQEAEAAGNGHVEEQEKEVVPAEEDLVEIRSHWMPKPCYRISGLSGDVSAEELSPLLEPHCKVASITLASAEKSDVAFVRVEPSSDGEDLEAKLKDAFAEATVKDHKLTLEPFNMDWLLFVGNLRRDINDEELAKMFEPHGQIERAFVMCNAEGKSKGYGFLEFSLKSQANAAKAKMGNLDMDGRVLRVEWTEVKKPADLFSSVLFVDRIAKETPGINEKLRHLFEQFGKVRECQMITGTYGQLRGFAFVDFVHSIHAEKAHQALDGSELHGLALRVNFANPSKREQVFKPRPPMASPEQVRGPYAGVKRASFGSPPPGQRAPVYSRGTGQAYERGPGGGRGMGPAYGGRGAYGASQPLSPQGGRGRFGGAAGRLPFQQPQYRSSYVQPYGQPRPVARGPLQVPAPAIAQVGMGQSRTREDAFKPREMQRPVMQPRADIRGYQQQRGGYPQQAPAAAGGRGGGYGARVGSSAYPQSGGTQSYGQQQAGSAAYQGSDYYQQQQQYKAPESSYSYQQRQASQQAPAAQQGAYYGAQQQVAAAQAATTGYGQQSGYDQQQAGYSQQYREQAKQQDQYAEYYAQQAAAGAVQGAAAGGGYGSAGSYSQGTTAGAGGGYGAAATTTGSGAAYSQADPNAAYYEQQAGAASGTTSSEQTLEQQWAAYYASQAAASTAGSTQPAAATAAGGYSQQAYGAQDQQAASYYQGAGTEAGQKRTAEESYGYAGYGTDQQQQQGYGYSAQQTAATAYGQVAQADAYGDYKRPRQSY